MAVPTLHCTNPSTTSLLEWWQSIRQQIPKLMCKALASTTLLVPKK
jgi:hypothetical protein